MNYIMITTIRKDKPRDPSISQGGPDLWFEQAIALLAGRQSCIMIGRPSYVLSKRWLSGPPVASLLAAWGFHAVLDLTVLFAASVFFLNR